MARGALRISLLMAGVDGSLDFLALLDEVEDETVSRLVHEMDPHSVCCDLGDRDTLDILSVCDLTPSCDNMASHSDHTLSVADDRYPKHGHGNVEEFCSEKNGWPDPLLKTFSAADSVPTKQNTVMVLQLKPSASSQVISREDKKSKPQQRHRWKFSMSQQQQLNDVFKKTMYPSKWRITELSKDLQVPVRTLRVWFQNRRWRLRKSQGISGSMTVRGSRTMLPDQGSVSLEESHPLQSSASCSPSDESKGSSNSMKSKTVQSSITSNLCNLKPALTTASTTAFLAPAVPAIPIYPSYLFNQMPAPCSNSVPVKDSRQASYNWGLPSLVTGWNLQSSLYWPSPNLHYLPSSYPSARQFSSFNNCSPSMCHSSSLPTPSALDLSAKPVSSNPIHYTSPISFPLSFTKSVRDKFDHSVPASNHSIPSIGQCLPSTYHCYVRPLSFSVPDTSESTSNPSTGTTLNKITSSCDSSLKHLQTCESSVAMSAPGTVTSMLCRNKEHQSSLCLPSSTCPSPLTFSSSANTSDFPNGISLTKPPLILTSEMNDSQHTTAVKMLATPVVSNLPSLCPCRECQRFCMSPSWPVLASVPQPDLTTHSSYQTACLSTFPPVTIPHQFPPVVPQVDMQARSSTFTVAAKVDNWNSVSERVIEECRRPHGQETKINSSIVELNSSKNVLHPEELDPETTGLNSTKTDLITVKMEFNSNGEKINTKSVESDSSLGKQHIKLVELNFNRKDVYTQEMELISYQGDSKWLELNSSKELNTKGLEVNSYKELPTTEMELSSSHKERQTNGTEVISSTVELHRRDTNQEHEETEDEMLDVTSVSLSPEQLFST